MKKTIFTAIAMMAFSLGSMAENKKVLPIKTISESKVLSDEGSCAGVWNAVYIYAKNKNFSNTEAARIASAAAQACNAVHC